MSTKKAYKQKIEGELELALAKLTELKARAKISSADFRIRYNKRFEELDLQVAATKDKLKELEEAGEDAWENLKGDVEKAWGSLSAAVLETAAKFKD